jgi:hypothetical protein
VRCPVTTTNPQRRQRPAWKASCRHEGHGTTARL